MFSLAIGNRMQLADTEVAITLEACHAVEIFQEAFAKFGEPEIVNTEEGSQGAATQFTTAVLDQAN